MLNTCYRFIFNKEDAEDIAQEVFIEIHRSITAFKEESKLSTWIYRIAVTKSIDFIRKTKRKKRMATLKSIAIMEEEAKDILAPKYFADLGQRAETRISDASYCNQCDFYCIFLDGITKYPDQPGRIPNRRIRIIRRLFANPEYL